MRDRPILVLDDRLAIADAARIARGEASLALGAGPRQRIAAAHERLKACVAESRLVYGVTTGFGPLADRLIAPGRAAELQRKLVYHLATGVGRPLPFAQARGCALARLSAIAQGWSGASPRTVEALLALVNSDLAPLVPEQGTVGASGDLTPLSHLTLALMGEGGFLDRAGARVDTASAFARLGVAPLTLEDRDGLALVNGTSVMTAIAVDNAVRAARLARWAVALTAVCAEALQGRSEAWDARFAEARAHPGQAEAAQSLRRRIIGSRRIKAALAAETELQDRPHALSRPPQDAYTIRCAPQLIGAALDAFAFHDAVVERELNAASDNPIFAPEPPFALHGGNFMGSHVALAADAQKTAVITLANLLERQLARLTNERLNGGLGPFLTGGEPGLDSGLMGAQVTATALVAEMRALSGPASVHSLSTNADNQDVVSLGTIAARQACARLDDAFRIAAIAAIAAAQAVHVSRAAASFSSAALALVRMVVQRFAPLEADRPLAADIEGVAAALQAADPPDG